MGKQNKQYNISRQLANWFGCPSLSLYFALPNTFVPLSIVYCVSTMPFAKDSIDLATTCDRLLLVECIVDDLN